MSIHLKYNQAVELFRNTDLSRKEICKRCNLTSSEFNAYLQRHHRDLLIEKITKVPHADITPDTKLYGKFGQGVLTKSKYNDAILACRSLEYIEYNISQIARLFKLNPTGLGNQLRAHYPDILKWRYNEQAKRGIHTYQIKIVLKESSDLYAPAVELLKKSNYTLQEIAKMCNVSYTGFKQHVLFYHKKLVLKRRKMREKNMGQKYKGKKTGRNSIHEPKPDTVLKYAEALNLYSTTSLTLKDIASKTGVPYAGFYSYIRNWHRDLIVKRRGITCKEDVEVANLNTYKHYLASTFSKYADAIVYLKKSDESTAAVAKRFHLHPETFRTYLKEHEPQLALARGMVKDSNGKYHSRKSYEKYKVALEMYRTTPESLNKIARKTGNNPYSLGGFIKRNFPEYIDEHKRLTDKAELE